MISMIGKLDIPNTQISSYFLYLYSIYFIFILHFPSCYCIISLITSCGCAMYCARPTILTMVHVLKVLFVHLILVSDTSLIYRLVYGRPVG